jgi:hypothetical protein
LSVLEKTTDCRNFKSTQAIVERFRKLRTVETSKKVHGSLLLFRENYGQKTKDKCIVERLENTDLETQKSTRPLLSC